MRQINGSGACWNSELRKHRLLFIVPKHYLPLASPHPNFSRYTPLQGHPAETIRRVPEQWKVRGLMVNHDPATYTAISPGDDTPSSYGEGLGVATHSVRFSHLPLSCDSCARRDGGTG
jgi:hypothetical protein